MKIRLNGTDKELEQNTSVEELIKKFAPNNPRIIAEINGHIADAELWKDTTLSEGDQVELVTFVGGG